MADNSKEELNNKQEQSKVEKEINRVLNAREETYRKNVKSAGDTLDLTRQITEDIKDQLGMARAKAEADTGALSLARKLQQSAQAVTSELGNQGKVQRQLINDQNLLSSIRTEISIIDSKIGEEGATAAAKIAEALLEQQDLQKKIEEHRQEMMYLDEESKKNAQAKIDELINEVVQLDNQINRAEQLSETFNRSDIRRLVQLKQQETLGEKLIQQREAELEIQRKIEDRTGVTGALIEGVGGIMQRLGMRSGIFQNAMASAAEEMRAMAEESERVDENGKKIGRQFSKTEIAIEGLTELAKGFGKALTDPLTIALAIFDAFMKVDKASTDLQRLTGQNSTALAGFNSRLASSVDVLEVMADLTKQTGMNAQNIFSPDVLAGAAELKNTLGLAADEAGGLAMIAQTTGGDIDATTEAIVDQTSAFNAANRSAVSQGQVLRDVAKTSDGIKASFAGMPGALANAAASARRLGMDLSRLDAIAGSLMDFESSIEAELEAQLLTGKNINMAKARELALNNDLAGLSKELFKNSSSIAEFGKMNRIQQEAQAKALGMTRDELGKIAYQRALETGMTKEQAAAAAGVKKEDMERMAVQEKLAKAAEKLAQAFAPMLDILTPIVDLIGAIIKPVAWLIGGVMKVANYFSELNDKVDYGTSAFGRFADGVVSFFASIPKLIAGAGILLIGKSLKDAFNPNVTGGFFSNLKDNFSSIKDTVAGLKDKIVQAFTGKGKTILDDVKDKGKDAVESVTDNVKDKGKGVLEKAKDKTLKTASNDKGKEVLDKTKGADTSKLKEPSSPGKNLKEFLTNLAEGLKAMGNTKVLAGALNLIPASIGFIAFIPGMIGVKLMEYLDGDKVKANLEGLAQGLESMASLKTLAGAGVLVVSALGFIAMLPALPAMALLGVVAPLAASGLAALGPALGAFGAAAAPAIPILLTFAGLALSVGASLMMAAPAFEAFGNIIEKAFSGIAGVITAASNGISTIMDSVTPQSILSLAALGPALISAGLGLTAFSLSTLLAGPGLEKLERIAAMSDPLSTVGASLTAVAAGIAAMSAAINSLETEKLEEIKDLITTTAFAAPMVAATGAITSMIQGIAGGGNESKSDPAMIEKLDAILAAIKEGGDVYIDGNKAGQSLMLAANKSA